MGLMKRRIIGCFLLIVMLANIESCGTNYTTSFEKPQSLEKIIITDDVWGRVTIDNKVTTSNVDYFLSKLHPSKLNPSDLPLEAAIRAKLISRNSKKEMYFTEVWAYDGKIVYEGKDTESIYAI